MKPRSSRRRAPREKTESPTISFGLLLIPAFMALCMLLGGSSSGGYLANAALQLIAALVLGYSVARFGSWTMPRATKVLVAITACWIAWGIVQLVPLPPSIWTLAPGRELLEQRLIAAGLSLPWLPLSLDPAATVSHLASLLPPVAMGALILSRPFSDAKWLSWTIPMLALVSLLVGVGQLVAGQDSPLYFYQTTNQGLPVGLMANANHQANLMLCAIPFVASLAGSERAAGAKGQGRDMLFAAMAAMFLIGVAICQSYAGFVLALPVTVASWLIARPRSLGPARYIGPGVALVTVALLAAAIVVGPPTVSDPALSQAQLSRPAMYAVTVKAMGTFFPVGSGFGSFVPTYKLFENPADLTNVFVNHSHCDYLELALEGGLVGIALIAALLLWWISRATSIWFSRSPDRLERAAVVATAAILAHSLVDYPARTAAIAAILAAGLALMAPKPIEVEQESITGGRHLKVE